MLSRIKSIKQALRNSSEVATQLKYMATRKLDEYKKQAELITQFLIYDTQDKALAQSLDNLVNCKEEQEMHNLIAALSYSIPLYGTTVYPIYYADKIKIGLAATIVTEYVRQFDTRQDQKIRVFNGRSVSTQLNYIPAIDYTKVEKNVLNGLHFEPGMVPTKHVKTKPGAPRLRLDKRLKQVAKAASSMKLKVVNDISSEDVLAELMKGEDYQYALKGEGMEHRLAMKARFERYAEMFQIVQAKSSLSPVYLSINFDYRGRVYYDLTAVFLNPQSKIGKYMWEAFTPRRLGKQDYAELCFAACSIVERRSPEGSIEYFETNEESIREHLLSEKKFLSLVYNKRVLKAIDDYRTGTKSRFLLLLDWTTGGLVHFSSGYTQEKKPMVLANLVKGQELHDTHQTMADEVAKVSGIHISRDDAKVINQSILAGVSLASMTKKFNEHFGDELFTKEQIQTIGRDVYGKTFDAFHLFNKWGKGLVDNANSSLKWVARDGVKCMSSAYIKGQEIKVYIPVIGQKSTRKVTVYRNMPLLIDNNSQKPLLVGKEAKAKMSGYLANTTHSVDAIAMREMIVQLAEAGEVGIFIHDNIGTFGINHNTIIRPAAQESVQWNFENKVFLDMQRQSSENRKGSVIPVLDFSVNDIENFTISSNFLQA